jgi:hypothetical protein
MADPPTKRLFAEPGSEPMSLGMADMCTCWKVGWKSCFVQIQLLWLCQFTFGPFGANIWIPLDFRLSIVVRMSIMSPKRWKECWVFCAHTCRIFVRSTIGRGVPKGMRWSSKSWLGCDGTWCCVFSVKDTCGKKGRWWVPFVSLVCVACLFGFMCGISDVVSGDKFCVFWVRGMWFVVVVLLGVEIGSLVRDLGESVEP